MADDAFSQFGQGMERGVKLAQHAEQIAQSREELEEKKRLNLIKVGDTIMEAYNNAATLKDAKARKVAFDDAKHKAELLGHPVSEASHAMLTSDAYRTEMLQATASMLGMGDAQKAENYGSMGALLRDPKLLQGALMGIGDRANQLALAKARQQTADPIEPAKQLAALQTSVGNQLKPSAEAVGAYQTILGLSHEDANNLTAHQATILLNKIADPGSVVREGEVSSMSAAAANGLWNETKMLIRDKAGKGKLSKEEWRKITQTAAIMSKVHRNRIASVRKDYDKLLQGTPLTGDMVFAGMPGAAGVQAAELASAKHLSPITVPPKGKQPVQQAQTSAGPPAKPAGDLTPSYATFGIDPKDPMAQQKLTRELIRKYYPEEAKALGLDQPEKARSGGGK